MYKNITIFGSTGFIGRQTLEVAKNLGIDIFAITANKNIDILEMQIRQFKPKFSVITDYKLAKKLRTKIKDLPTKILFGEDELCNPSLVENVDVVVNAIVGIAGLKPSVAALKAKKNLALANKESLVVSGKLLTDIAKKNHVSILPIDSEHSAIFQCLNGKFSNISLKKIILTASGGPFFGKKKEDLLNVNVENALNHPTWNMGKKITIDSATMMNKGFEIIEAHHLFNISVENIDVLIHRESIIHSMVEFLDNSIIANLSLPDMRLPIQYALTYPERAVGLTKSLDLAKINKLTFFEPDFDTFEAINICKNAIILGETLPAAINGANEVAVELFLENKISFLEIINLVKMMCNEYKNKPLNTIKDVIFADQWARNFVKANVKHVKS